MPETAAYDFNGVPEFQRSRHCRLVYVTYRKVSVNSFIRRKLGGTAVYYRPFAHCAEGLFCCLAFLAVLAMDLRRAVSGWTKKKLRHMCGLQIKGFIFIKEKKHAGFKRAE